MRVISKEQKKKMLEGRKKFLESGGKNKKIDTVKTKSPVSTSRDEIYQNYLITDFSVEPPYPVMKAIKFKCLNCCGWERKETELCNIRNCSLWPYRFGHRPRQGENLIRTIPTKPTDDTGE